MNRKIRIISLVLSLILIIGFMSLSYGADFEMVTGSALAYNPKSGIKAGTSDTRATPPTGSSTDPIYVEPYYNSASSRYTYTFNTSTQQESTAGTSVNILHFGDMVSQITASIAGSAQGLAHRIHYDLNYISGHTSGIYSILQNGITTTIGQPFIKYFMPDTNYDYTADAWKKYIIRTANSTSASTTNKENESFILQFKDYLNAQNLIEYWTYKREYDYVIPDDYASETYNKWINVNTGAEYTAFKRSVWVDIRYINRFLSNLIYKTTGILSGTTFNLYDYNNTANTVTPNSLYDYIRMSNEKITQSLGRLAYVLANDQDIALRETSPYQNASEQFNTSFFKNTALNKITWQDISNTAKTNQALKSAFTSSATAQDALNGFTAGTDGRWDWFSTEILNSLDTTTNNRKSNDNLTNFLDSYYNDIDKYVDGELQEDLEYVD